MEPFGSTCSASFRGRANPIAVPSAMPSASELPGSNGHGLTKHTASSPRLTAVLIFAAADALRIPRTTGVNANTAKLAIPTAPAFTNQYR